MRVGGQRHAPAALPPGKTRYPLYSRLGGAPGPFWKGAENLAPNGIRSPDRPARSESLYRLSYPGPLLRQYNKQYISLKSVILNIRNNHFLLNWRVLKSFMKIKGYLFWIPFFCGMWLRHCVFGVGSLEATWCPHIQGSIGRKILSYKDTRTSKLSSF